MQCPCSILVFSGKRKSGKDFVADVLVKRFGVEICQILRLSGPLKKQYAEEHGLDYKELLNASTYKENYRAKMIKWGEEKRNSEPYFFCDKTVADADINLPLWIISDARRITDVQYFKEKYQDVVKFVRITATDSVREQRGFVFTPGVDDAESECGLDIGVTWDFIINNDNNNAIFESDLSQIIDYVNGVLPR
ncbi:hypothetical protein ACF0H5_015364 [Mactra antiquata]